MEKEEDWMRSLPKRIHVNLFEEIEKVRVEEKLEISFVTASRLVADYSRHYRQRRKKPLWQREI